MKSSTTSNIYNTWSNNPSVLLKSSSSSSPVNPNITPETNISPANSSTASLPSTTTTINSSACPSRLTQLYWEADKTTLPALQIRLRAHNLAKRKIREIIQWRDFHGCAYNEQDVEYVKWISYYFEVEMWSYKFITKEGIAPSEYRIYGPHSIMITIAAFLEPNRFRAYNWYCNHDQSSKVQVFADWLVNLIKIYHDEKRNWLEATKQEVAVHK